VKQYLGRILALAGLVFVGLAAAGYFFFERIVDTAAPRPSVHVPADWHEARESPGHYYHLIQGIQCRECHDIGVSGFDFPPADRCGWCHDNRDNTHAHSVLASNATECFSCHTFLFDDEFAHDQCRLCHASAQGDVAAVGVHLQAECRDCHDPHDERSIVPRACVDCHRTEATRHGRKRGAQVRACLDCHLPHEPVGGADRACVRCHAEAPPKVSARAKFKGHDKCVTCHPPHGFTKQTVIACENCHPRKPVLGARKTRKHATCDRCHIPHDARSGRASCTKCHEKIVARHPEDDKGGGGECLGCHPVHDGKRELVRGAVSCVACHDKAATETSFHSGAKCADCHRKHDYVGSSSEAQACQKCHRKPVGDKASIRPAEGHDVCTECHKKAAHEPKLATPTCVSCHKEQRASAPKGHDECAKCHTTHGGELRKEATCRKCHEDQSVGAHSRNVKDDCNACHRAHGPKGVAKAPTCESCHEQAQLRGLHAHKDHRKCSDCHEPHERKQNRERVSCMSDCHNKLVKHEPKAKLCTGCHPFVAR
jgi:hypothetical protein